MKWTEKRALKAEGHRLLDEIIEMKSQLPFYGRVRNKRSLKGYTYNFIGKHFSDLNDAKELRDAVDLLRRQKSALEDAVSRPLPSLVRKSA